MRKFFLIVLVLAVVAGGGWALMLHRVHAPYRGFTADEIFVDLPNGIGVAGIARRLADERVVPDTITFRLAARLAGADRRLRAGEYRFAGEESPWDVVARLARGDVYTHPVTFPEGLTIHEMAAIFAKSGQGTAQDFETAARDVTLVANLDPDATSLEGFLFPDTYPLSRFGGAPEAVAAMAARFDKALNPGLRAEAVAKQMSIRDLVTLASIVEKETAQPDERPLVAAVYTNRLKIGMLLQCDPTVIYALEKEARYNGKLTRADLKFPSPYNTYVSPGLPPGPIMNPGFPSLRAAVQPASTKHLYFVRTVEGRHTFSDNLAAHNRAVAAYRALQRGGGN